MTRTARRHARASPGLGQRERVLEGEPALVERGADDRALDARRRPAPCSAARSSSVGDAAGGDDRPVGGGADVAQQVEVGALEHAVLVDVGDDVAGAALAVEPGQHLVEVAALAGPAARGQRAAADVEADRDPVAVLGDRRGAPLRLLERGGADVDPAAAGGHRRLQRLVVADAAAHLDRRCRACRRSGPAARGCGRGRTPRRGRPGGSTRRRRPASAAPPRPGRRSASPSRPRPARAGRPGRRRRRRRAAARGAGHRRCAPGCGDGAVGGSYGPRHRRDAIDRVGAAPEVGRPPTLQPVAASAPSCAAGAAPASPDFSGWNWVADSGPFSTAATNRSPPCSAQVTSGGRGCGRW